MEITKELFAVGFGVRFRFDLLGSLVYLLLLVAAQFQWFGHDDKDQNWLYQLYCSGFP